ncbi:MULTISPECIES: hypothetical protein [unclassified Sphingomonas]|uniref:hypothetical protein n=1 Tax=unclassified Sphingomonas TaxID=196159 RepID=UPI000700F0D4|nr:MULTISPECIES: hypothetical protein [unclassified Sphingomonas]KQM62336.1 hypothetical protein ASE65_04895 [Sphingomonas sp. Leaf16]KQN13739.1 hypothetical protein ASE81_04965 [Sphingomonas sp. Leaf29]KQN23030.1 hypothetical protein ASE83_00445 [Sphingomonas sp. Leaf32]
MPTPMTAWWQIWTDAARSGLQVWETLAASAVVIDRRMPMIDAGMRNPWTADHVELTGMVTEKAQAFAKAGDSLAADMAAMQGLWMQMMQDAWSLGTAGRMPSPGRVAASSDRAMRLAAGMIGAGGRALTPIHAKATANAKRLGPQKK